MCCFAKYSLYQSDLSFWIWKYSPKASRYGPLFHVAFVIGIWIYSLSQVSLTSGPSQLVKYSGWYVWHCQVEKTLLPTKINFYFLIPFLNTIRDGTSWTTIEHADLRGLITAWLISSWGCLCLETWVQLKALSENPDRGFPKSWLRPWQYPRYVCEVFFLPHLLINFIATTVALCRDKPENGFRKIARRKG